MTAPPSPIIPNCCQIRFRWHDPSKAFLNVFHGNVTAAGPLNPSIGETLFAALKGSSGAVRWLANLPTSTVFDGVDVRDLRSPNNPLLSSTSAAVPGTSATGALPPQVAIAMTLRTAQAGRQFRGRIYFGGLAAVCDDTTGHIATGPSGDLLAWFNDIFTTLNANGMPMCIGQKELLARPGHGGTTLPHRPAAAVPVTSYLVRNNIFDTQRRRSRPGIGSR